MVAIVLSAVLALVSHSASTASHSANFPSKGNVVPGHTIGGIGLGMTEAQVKLRWGHNYTICTGCGHDLTWLYEYPGGEPLGAAVKFNLPNTAPPTGKPSKTTSKAAAAAAAAAAAGKVVSVFTLGSPAGWGVKGAMMFDPVSNVYNIFGNPGTANCVGYTALTIRIGSNTMSFYSASGVIYGFALTVPSQSPCQ
ncbi:MAG TPA: hypothetical protein VMV08_01465 [Gaiellaceae bacterium]|nr:hypothetical protein [Gaiellaceae bacterium]